MRRSVRVALLVLCAFFTLSLINLPSSATAITQSESKTFLYVVDTSGSMVGKGEGNPANIMAKVKANIVDHISNRDIGSSIVIMPFHDGVQKKQIREFALTDEAARKKAIDYVNGLKADGQRTRIYSSMVQAVQYKPKSAGSGDDGRWIYVYSDAREEEGDDRDFGDVASAFDLERAEADNIWLTYQSLGVKIGNDVKDIAKDHDGIEIIESDRNVVTQVVKISMPTLKFTPKMMALTVPVDLPKSLEGSEFSVTAKSDELLAESVVVGIDPAKGELGESVLLTLMLENGAAVADQSDAVFNGTITFKGAKGVEFSPAEVPFTYSVKNDPMVTLVPENPADKENVVGRLGRTYESVDGFTRRWVVEWDRTKPGATVALRVAQGGAAQLPEGTVLLKTETNPEGSTSVTVTPEDGWVELVVAPENDTPKGEYSVTLKAVATNAELQVVGGTPATDGSGEMDVPTEFSVGGRGLSLPMLIAVIVGGVLGLLIAAFLLYCLFTLKSPAAAWMDLMYMLGLAKPLITDARLVIREPVAMAGRAHSIASQPSAMIGMGGEFLADTDIPGYFVLEAYRQGTSPKVKVVAGAGSVAVKAAGQGLATAVIGELDIKNGDTITLGTYSMRFESNEVVS